MIEQKYSTFWPRFCAGLFDGLILWPISLLCSFAYLHWTSAFVRVSAYIVDSSIGLIYSIWMHWKFGQTLGKMANKIVVLDISERPLNLRQAVLRDIAGVVLLPIGLARDIPRIIYGINVYATTEVTTVAVG